MDFSRFESAWDEEITRSRRTIRARVRRLLGKMFKNDKRKDDLLIWISPDQVMTRNGNVLRLEKERK